MPTKFRLIMRVSSRANGLKRLLMRFGARSKQTVKSATLKAHGLIIAALTR
nr:MAG TPA: hypothetical protein [Caudoviricetes sp.]